MVPSILKQNRLQWSVGALNSAIIRLKKPYGIHPRTSMPSVQPQVASGNYRRQKALRLQLSKLQQHREPRACRIHENTAMRGL